MSDKKNILPEIIEIIAGAQLSKLELPPQVKQKLEALKEEVKSIKDIDKLKIKVDSGLEEILNSIETPTENQSEETMKESSVFTNESVMALLGIVLVIGVLMYALDRDIAIRKELAIVKRAQGKLIDGDFAGYFEEINEVVPKEQKALFVDLKLQFISDRYSHLFSQQLKVFANELIVVIKNDRQYTPEDLRRINKPKDE